MIIEGRALQDFEILPELQARGQQIVKLDDELKRILNTSENEVSLARLIELVRNRPL